MKAAALGESEDEACREIIQRFHEAPEFKIQDVHIATNEELDDLEILPDDVQEAKDNSLKERLN